MKETQKFLIRPEDSRHIEAVFVSLTQANGMGMNVDYHVTVMNELMRQIGWQYGFDPLTVSKTPSSKPNELSAMADILWFDRETGIWEV